MRLSACRWSLVVSACARSSGGCCSSAACAAWRTRSPHSANLKTQHGEPPPFEKKSHPHSVLHVLYESGADTGGVFG